MLVSQLMHKDFITVRPNESVQEAARKMREKNIGALLVVEDDKFQGILTEKEISAAAAADSGIADKDKKDRCVYFSDVLIDELRTS
ncbi:MAG: CBS domain-containing protein [Nitrospirae bacterium]|nr:CBS domain-containing protein [Nitrospirota bacterium]